MIVADEEASLVFSALFPDRACSAALAERYRMAIVELGLPPAPHLTAVEWRALELACRGGRPHLIAFRMKVMAYLAETDAPRRGVVPRWSVSVLLDLAFSFAKAKFLRVLGGRLRARHGF